MQEHYTPKGKHLTIDNRRLIERWKNENKSNREIAGLLGKAREASSSFSVLLACIRHAASVRPEPGSNSH
ncbi:transposase-like protein, IS1239 [Streptococcus pneumoniae]|nr:transposase-like protein, IS1239 [Streptococcus pneumoniae]